MIVGLFALLRLWILVGFRVSIRVGFQLDVGYYFYSHTWLLFFSSEKRLLMKRLNRFGVALVTLVTMCVVGSLYYQFRGSGRF